MSETHKKFIVIVLNSDQEIEHFMAVNGVTWLKAALRQCRLVSALMSMVGVAESYTPEEYCRMYERLQKLVENIREVSPQPTEEAKNVIKADFLGIIEV